MCADVPDMEVRFAVEEASKQGASFGSCFTFGNKAH